MNQITGKQPFCLLILISMSLLGGSLCPISLCSIRADEIGFIERYALAKDRAAVLRELIPGTEDYYYFHCLHFQNTEQYDKSEAMLDKWISRRDYPFRAGQTLRPRAREIVNRQMLLTYPADPKRSLAYLEKYLKLNFNHQRESMGGPVLPTVLNPALISRKTLTVRALARHSGTRGFEASALAWLLDEKLTDSDQHDALKQLPIPDHPKLVEYLDKYLSNDTHEFGQLGIHRLLTQQQLLQLEKLKPRLMNNTNYIYACLSKIRPNPDVHFESDLAAQEKQLNELWDFVKQLEPVYNTLKAHVLYHRLVYDRSIDVYDRDRFLEYIKLPREANYIEPKYHRQRQFQNYKVNFNQDYRNHTLYPRIGNDEPLIRSLLHHFFKEDQDFKQFESYLHQGYLKRHFAEAKIVNGLGDNEQWASYLSAVDYKNLRNRVDLDFVYTSKQRFGADDPVSVQLDVKNVQKLIVKVFEINTRNYYRDLQKEIDTNIELDGLLPNKEYTFEYDESPFRRVQRKFDFPELKKPGVYVVDFIGNRKSSRALIRKGRLRYIEEVTAAGQQLSIVDEKNQPVKEASVWIQGARYAADKEGLIMIPFSNRPGRIPMVISRGEFSSLDDFTHQAESYGLNAGFHVDRESLIQNTNAKVIVRPQLRVNGIPASVSLLKNARLTISSTDLDGSVSTKVINDFKLFEDRESEFEFKVPKRLQGLSFSLTGTLKNLSQNKEITLSGSDSFYVNTIDTDVKVEDLHLLQINGQYHLDLLGKTGEIRAARPVQFTLKHRDFRDPVRIALQTSMQGRIKLGALQGISSIQVAGPQGTTRSWNLQSIKNTYYSSIYVTEGEQISVPIPNLDKQIGHQEVALLEMRGGTYVRNALSNVKHENGLLTLSGLTRGDYRLFIKNITTMEIKVVKGSKVGSVAVNQNRQIELKPRKPLQITGIDRNKKETTLRVSGFDKFTRVHVVATRYVPRFNLFEQLRMQDAEPALTMLPQSQSLYVAGRKIGDEYQYILDRKYAEKFPGVMLKRQGLLLQPWAVRTTQTSRQDPNAGTRFGRVDQSNQSKSSRPKKQAQGSGPKTDSSNLDFVGEGSVVLLNLVLDEKGQLKMGNEVFKGLQHLQFCVVGPTSAASENISFDETPLEPSDLRLVLGLDPGKRFARKKEISFVDEGKNFEITDFSTGEFEIFDNLPNVYRLFTSLSGGSKLGEFRFILEWNDKDLKEKLGLYSKYACHELNFFIYKKDPEFFASVVKPYLANKRHKTFLDKWLLGVELSEFRQPWKFNELNTVECILLSQALEGEAQYTSRKIREHYYLNPTPQSRFDHLFGFALQGNALEIQTGTLIEKVKDLRAGEKQEALSKLDQIANVAPKPGQNNGIPAGGGGFAAGRQSTKSSEKKSAANRALQEEEFDRLDGESKLGKSRRGRDNLEADKFYKEVAGKRKQVAQLFRQIDKTQEWAENNYYKLTIDKQIASLVKTNQFWRDYAEHQPDLPFYSVNVAEASSNFTEMMFALAVLDLEWKPGKHDTKQQDAKLVLTADSPLLIYHDQIRPVKDGRKETSVLVSQNFFRVDDRYRYEGPDRLDKFVTDEFIKRTAYGCQVVVTNPTSAKQKIDLLVQIPRGSMPLKSTRKTRSIHVELDPYRTSSVEYYFYFPESGEYQHYPVNVARNEEVIAFAEPMKFNVVHQPSKVDKTSWGYVSQFGTEQEVLDYLAANNLRQTELGKIAWRMKDKAFFTKVVTYLDRNHLHHPTLWAYSVMHNAEKVIRQTLNFNDNFVNQTGPYINTALLTNDRIARRTFEHLEYDPLVNARAHQLGQNRQILNDRFNGQYHRLLWILGCKKNLDDTDHLALSYYLLLQDRVSDAKDYFGRVSKDRISSQLQYDYMAAYLDMYNENPALARQLATMYKNYPVVRWQKAFAEIQNQLNEIDGKGTEIVDGGNRENIQDNLASKTSSFDFKVDAKQVDLNFQNLDRVQVNYYVMDVELLFSRNPFVQQYSGELTYIRPRKSEWIELPKGGNHKWDLPGELNRSNVLVEISGGELLKSQAYYAHAMNVQMIESFGQLKVIDAKNGRNVPKTYCKVYAKLKNGQTRFYKDGYTDLRGRFDYTSLSTNELDNVEKFSVLVMSDQLGATVREAIPPKR